MLINYVREADAFVHQTVSWNDWTLAHVCQEFVLKAPIFPRDSILYGK